MNSREMKQEREVRPTKTFITVIAQQGLKVSKDDKGNEIKVPMLEALKYETPNEGFLKCETEIRFPISAVIESYVQEGDTIRIIAIKKKDDDNADRNYKDFFIPEVKAILSSKSVDFNMEEDVEIIEFDSELDPKQNNQLFMNILKSIGDNEILHTCITFGLKPITIILFAAVYYAYMVKKNVKMESMVYGQKDWLKPNAGGLHEQSSLFYTNVVLNRMAQLGEEDPITFLESFKED